MITPRYLLLLFSSVAIRWSLAQLPAVDISAVAVPGDQVEIRLRPDASFNGVLSSVVFTLEWPEAGGATLDAPLQDVPQVQYCYVAPSGTGHQQDGRRFQVYAGFGTVPLSNLGAAWQAGQEVVLCRVPVIGGPASVSISTAAWTAANNGSYYISLNGEDRTGSIYGAGATSIGEGEANTELAVWTDAAQGLLMVRTTGLGSGAGLEIAICDVQGKVLQRQHRMLAVDHQLLAVPIGTLPSGTYLVDVRRGGTRSVQRVVWMP